MYIKKFVLREMEACRSFIAWLSGPKNLLFKQQVIAEIYNIIFSNQSISWAF